MGVTVRQRADGTFPITELKDDGILAEVVSWPAHGYRVRRVVQRMGDDLRFIGSPAGKGITGFFQTREDTLIRVRLLGLGDVMEITKD